MLFIISVRAVIQNYGFALYVFRPLYFSLALRPSYLSPGPDVKRKVNLELRFILIIIQVKNRTVMSQSTEGINACLAKVP